MNWKHLWALVQLRLQLSRNQQIRVSKFNYYLTKIAMGVIILQALVTFAISAAVGGYVFRGWELSSVALTWHYALVGLLFYWLMMVLGQMQLPETVSFERLLHLPVSFSNAFMLNFVSSFSNSAVWLGAPVLIGISIGAMIAKGFPAIGFLLATLAWIFFLASLTHLFRGWISRLVKNKRTKGMLAIAVPFSLVFAALIFTYDGGANSAFSILKQNIGIAIGNAFRDVPTPPMICGLLVIGFSGLLLSYKSLVRQYLTPSGRSKRGVVAKKETVKWSRTMKIRIPGVSEQASVVAMGMFKSILRAPEIIAAIIPQSALLILGSPYLFGWSGFDIPELLMPWIPSIIITTTMLGFPAFLFSTFSYDRDGFRALLLSPISRSDILYGKNLGLGIFTISSGFLTLLVFQLFFPDSALVFLSHLINLVATYLLICIAGNVITIYCPIGLKRGTMQPVNAPILSTVLLYIGLLTSPFLVIQPTMTAVSFSLLTDFSFSSIDGVVYLPLSILVLIGAVVFYWLSLAPLGQSFWQQQSKIVNTVTNIPE